MRYQSRLFLLVFILAFLLMGNMAPPYAPCVNKAEGDACTQGYSCTGNNGTCQLQTNCIDATWTLANECLFCQGGAGTHATSPLGD